MRQVILDVGGGGMVLFGWLLLFDAVFVIEGIYYDARAAYLRRQPW